MKSNNYRLRPYGKVMMVFIMALGVMFASCQKEEGEVIVDTDLELMFKDAKGNDLLNANTPNAFSHDKIDLYYLINGEKERAFEGHLDHPKKFFVYQAGNQHIMRLFPSLHEKDTQTQTFIKLNETDTDTITCTIRKWGKNNQSVAVTKVWYNNKLVWDGTGGRYIEVVK